MENKLIAHGTATENVDGKDDYGVQNKGMQIYHTRCGVGVCCYSFESTLL